MQFIVETLSLHDEIGNRFFSIVGPLLILYALVYQFLGEKIAGLLLKNDTYSECKIRIRPYFILQRLLVVGVFAYGIILSASCGGFVQMAMFIVVLGGYFCIFIFSNSISLFFILLVFFPLFAKSSCDSKCYHIHYKCWNSTQYNSISFNHNCYYRICQ